MMPAYTGPRACLEWQCIRHAIPGSDFCATHAQAPPGTLRLTRKFNIGGTPHQTKLDLRDPAVTGPLDDLESDIPF